MLRPGVVALLLCSALLIAPAAATTPRAADPTDPGGAARAESALARVEALFAAPRFAAAATRQADRSPTLALRDLALAAKDLSPQLRRRASPYFARPTAHPQRCPDAACYDTKRVRRACTAVLCVHYVHKGDDPTNGVPRRDSDADGRPDYVERVVASLTHVHRTYVAAGYRRPVGDGGRGGDARPDVYLAQIGNRGMYGYCTTDPDSAPLHGPTWAYCVLDNDYARDEFPQHTPIENMRVTAAHEYFHAVQFGYDFGEDAWFMEATATWVEDEVYDRVDDNVSYLARGPIGEPALSLDWPRDGYWYGAWIFFRHLTEQHPASQAGLPVLVRTLWHKADARAGAPDLSSVVALEEALAEQGSSVGAELLLMAANNLRPRRWYDEGAHYPAAVPDRSWRLTPAEPGRAHTVALDHLTSASYRIVPAPGMSAEDWQLRLTLDLADVARGSRALARVFLRSGGVQSVVLDLDATGGHDGTVPFSATAVKAVELTVVNASTRYKCGVATMWSCDGRPLDQDLAQSVVVRAER